MAKDGRSLRLCAGLALLAGGLLSHSPACGQERDSAVATTLAVQTAMQQGRDHLVRGDAKSAVYVLEAQLSRINGSSAYLALLRDAYRAHVKQLRLANQDTEAQVYLKRLQILDPGAALDAATARSANAPAPTPPDKPTRSPEPKVVRGSMADEDPLARSVSHSKRQDARSLVRRAEEEFRGRHYGEAWLLFEQAHQADADALSGSREKWAYCKLHRVVEQINHPPAGAPAWPDLEQEVRLAMALAPRLDYGKVVLAEIQRLRAAHPDEHEPPPNASSVAVRHFERGNDGWARAETANFRIFHKQSPDLAEQAARVAENTRIAMYRKWFGRTEPDWNPKCDLYLHATGRDYTQATGVMGNSPGHSSFRVDGGRVLMRRMDLHCEARNLLAGVLPHETTHVVLGSQFLDQPIPRWADEGMAVLTEPPELVERHLRNLSSCRQNGQTLSLRQVMQLNDYPEPRLISGFYAESVSLVDYLSSLRGPQEFAQFLHHAQKEGYEPALRRHYSIPSFAELEQRWSQYAFAPRSGATEVAAKSQ